MMRTALMATTAMALALPSAAFAQVTPAPGATTPAPSEQAASPAQTPETGLGDIIVTAQRRTENLQRVAVAVDVVQGADLVKAGITNPGRLGELAPALTVQPGSTGNIVFVRGVGNFTVSPNSDPAVAFNYDGVYVARPSSQSGTFYDLERIEVLKGPQGTLYGRNATGGAINVLPTQPKLGELSGYGTVSYGNYDALTAEGAVNLPLGDKGAIRVSGNVSSRKGYLADGTNDERVYGGRVQMKAELTDTLTMRVSGDYSHTGGIGYSVSYRGNYVYSPVTGQYTFNPSGQPSSDGVYAPGSQAYRQTVTAGTAGRKIDGLSPYPFQDSNYYGTNAQVDWQTGIGTFTIVPAFRYANLNYLSSAGAFAYRQREKDQQFSVEARLAGKRIGIFDYTLGAIYFDETIRQRTAINLSSAVSFLNEQFTTKSYAPFGRLTAHLTERLRLVGGIRYTKDDKTFSGPVTSGAIVCLQAACPNAPLFPTVDMASQIPFFPPAGVAAIPLAFNFIPTPAGVVAVPTTLVVRADRNDNSKLSNSKVTYRGAVEFDVGPRSLAYASYETGYRSGGFSAAQGFETYQPEFLTAYTVGLKNRFFDNRVQLNLEGFYWDYNNQQVNHVGLDLNGRSANFTQNIGKSRIKGVEVEGRVLVTPTTLISADVQYLDGRDLSFVYQSAAGTPPTPPVTGCATTLNAAVMPAVYNVDCSGKPSYNSPKITVNAAAQQTFHTGDYDLVVGADTQYKSSRAIGFQYLPEQTLRANFVTNAQVSFGPRDGRWSIAGFVRNIEGDRIPFYSSLHPTANFLIETTGAPRTFGGRVSAKF